VLTRARLSEFEVVWDYGTTTREGTKPALAPRQQRRTLPYWDTTTVPVSDIRKLSDIRGATTVAVTDVDFASAWLGRGLAKLARLRKLGPQWESTGASPPNETALVAATEALVWLSAADAEPRNIDPSTDDGVCISFRNGERYADIECYNSGEILAVTISGEGEPVVFEVRRSELQDAVSKITRFVFER
jgi:hypothetical protein